jgi:hypothetical protein
MQRDLPASLFSQVIREHLELRRRNAALEIDMPLAHYMNDERSVEPAGTTSDRHLHDQEDTATLRLREPPA